MIAPISVCELDAGRPKYHVPTFHRMAPTSSARTIARPALGPFATSSSTGRSSMMPIATAIPPSAAENMTPAKLNRPDKTTASVGRSEFV